MLPVHSRNLVLANVWYHFYACGTQRLAILVAFSVLSVRLGVMDEVFSPYLVPLSPPSLSLSIGLRLVRTAAATDN